MGKINRSTVVGCPPDRVFAVLSQVERLADFSSMTVDIRNGPGRPVEVGDRFEQVVKVLGKELDTEWEVVEVQAPSLLRFEGTASAGARATLVERLTAEGTGTRVELDVDYDLPLGILGDAVDAVYLQSKNEEQAEEILGKLKALCETTP
ncbi:MAG: Polyketide cyclase / dehydrase and lipid transport [Acidimicrobiaceae bacterium]|jgi:ligand-binding SRPBCC domain-containing protein|nr:Polyketide cyclase / dehydrase and lipid transport [Acidimicrobiaceae bacterium]